MARQEKVSAGEEEKPQPRQEDYSLKVNVDSVLLNVSVLDRGSNRSVAGLNKQDFRVYEDGVQQQIDQFHPCEAPFNLLLLLDVSGSTQSYIDLMREASIDFIRRIKPNDRIAVATFNSSVQLIQGFTNDRAGAEQAILRIWPGGGTAFYDALMTSVNQYMRGVEGRSAIVVFTDGVDNQLFGDRAEGSRSTFDELYRRIQEVESLVYTIFLDTEGQYPSTARGPGGTNTTGAVIDILGGVLGRGRYPGTYPDPRGYPNPGPNPMPYPTPGPYPTPNPSPSPSPYPSPAPYPGPSSYPRSATERAAYGIARGQLMMIADQTGGRMHSPHRIDDLSRVYGEIALDLRVQYQLGYNSTNRARDGRWRQIQVKIDGHPEAMVRTRKGYYSR
jgi:VWFA-related protein